VLRRPGVVEEPGMYGSSLHGNRLRSWRTSPDDRARAEIHTRTPENLPRSQHDALDALAFGVTRTKVNYILDCDLRAFFDSVSHEWLIRFVEHRVADPRIIRLIRKWLKAGVMEDGEWTPTDTEPAGVGGLTSAR